MEPTCPNCKVTVRNTDFYCHACGRNLHEPPRSVGIGTQISYYIGSVFMPPIGIFWGIKYLREPDPKAKRVGVVCIVLTFLSVIYFSIQTLRVYQSVKVEVDTQSRELKSLF